MGGICTQNSSPAFAAAYQEVAIVARDHGIADGRLPTSVASILCPTEMALRPEGEEPTRILRDQFLEDLLALADTEALPLQAFDHLIPQPVQDRPHIPPSCLDAMDRQPQQHPCNVIPVEGLRFSLA